MKHTAITRRETPQEAADRLLQEDRDRRVRSYKVEVSSPLRIHQGPPFAMKNYGPGHWCVCEGVASNFQTEAAADEAGKRWVETGRVA